jgi:hypothetical protein
MWFASFDLLRFTVKRFRHVCNCQPFAAPEADGRPAGHITYLLPRSPKPDSALSQSNAINNDIQFTCDSF